MIQTFEDLCTYCYAIIEDIYREVVAPHDHRPGPAPGFTDAEVITLTLVAELVGLDAETHSSCSRGRYRKMLRTLMHGYIRREKGRRALFPLLPSRCRFNRRRRMLGEATNTIRRELKARLWWALDPEARELAAIDSLPVPVVGFNHAPGEHRWHGHAAFGRIASKKMTIYGFKVHLTISSSGLILDFALAPANHHDSLLAQQLLCGESDLLVLGDKAYIDEELKRELEARGNVLLLTRQRSNQKPEQSSGLGRAIDHFRQTIETVASQLAGQFSIESNGAKCMSGLIARLHSKLAAHTLGMYLNLLTGRPLLALADLAVI